MFDVGRLRILVNMDASTNPLFDGFILPRSAHFSGVPDIIEFSAQFAFDGLFCSFSFSTKTPFAPLARNIVDVYFTGENPLDFSGDTFLTSGIIARVSISQNDVYTVFCHSLGWLLSRSIVSPSAISITHKNVSPLVLANRFAAEFGLRFEAAAGANAANQNIKEVYESSATATPADVILDICRANFLFVNQNLGKDFLRILHVEDINTVLGRIDTQDPTTPIFDFSLEYDSENIFRNLIGFTSSDERLLSDFEEWTVSYAPFATIKHVSAQRNISLQRALERERAKAAISAVKLQFSIPDYKIGGNLIQTAANVVFNDPRHNIRDMEFFVTDININVSRAGITSRLTCCLTSALFGDIS